MTSSEPSLPADLRERVRSARRLVVLTGAGMSAESGVPVFRGPGGLWEGHRPEELATPEAFARDPSRVWRWYRWRLERVAEAHPHQGHSALVELERQGGYESFSIVTQNVDGLHQRAGSGLVLELHGTLLTARCAAGCGRRVSADTVDPENCGCVCGKGRLRPEVVWFGEGLPPRTLEDASRALELADMAWVVGTSSVVYPAAALPEMAATRGITVIEINPDPTPLSTRVTHSMRIAAGSGLAVLARERGVF